MSTIELNDIDVNYRQRGSGPPVVLLHGLAEDHRSWEAVEVHLDEFAVYTLDLRGHGRTTPGEGAGTLSQLSDDLTAFLDTVTGPAAVVGYSLGGTIGLKAATAPGTLIGHLVVAATSSVVGMAAAEFFEGRIAQLEAHDWHGFAAGLRDDTAKQVVTETDIDALASRRMDAVGDGRGYINAARAMIGIRSEPLNPLLARIEVPVDVIGASSDVFCPRRASDIIVDNVGDCRYHEVAGAGHLLSIDQPDAYGKLVARLLHDRGTT
ncbi:MAG: alpha/beta fold hydrolase [Acidimicrobiaceae bacterium]|nr:alpha/beta fold hydrolase [Acidimicrobiaceae bacterium]MYE08585.1 alpha/beta fold hydrolase [Acidimicrobiaceae bacterium]MYI35150.1 alpha/beta fold hydrolase [Acidimicrobiaceae bacterium]